MLSEMDENPTIDRIVTKWRKIFEDMKMTSTMQGSICEAKVNVDTKSIGQTFIAEFKLK